MITTEEIETIRKESIIAEESGELSPKQLQLIVKNEWFHLLVPKSLGGKEMPLVEFVLFIEKLAIADGSFAWAVNLGAGANMFSGYMDQEKAKSIFQSKKTCVAGSGAISGTAKKIENEYIIDGQWKYASGSAHANYFSLNATLIEEDKVRSFLVPRNKVEILSTWNAMGLKASSSNDFKVSNQKVEEEMMFNLLGPSKFNDFPLYRFPFMQLAEMNMLVILTGLTIRFRELVEDISKNKQVNYKDNTCLLMEHPDFQKVLKKHKNDFEQKRTKVFQLFSQMWHINMNNRNIPIGLEKKFGKILIQTAVSSRNLVYTITPFVGMNLIFNDSELNRVWRDFSVAAQHSLLSPLRLHKYL